MRPGSERDTSDLGQCHSVSSVIRGQEAMRSQTRYELRDDDQLNEDVAMSPFRRRVVAIAESHWHTGMRSTVLPRRAPLRENVSRAVHGRRDGQDTPECDGDGGDQSDCV